jgi:tungstate transport system ATP-binding protein
MTIEAPAFELQDLTHVYDGATVLDIDRLSIAAGAITGLVGPNGSGKSTLLRLLGCIETPSRGRIVYNNQPIKPFSEAARFKITLLPQEPFLMKRSVFNNVSYGLKLRGENRAASARVQEALAFVGLPAEHFAGRPWYALSGGETQRVALAARLVLRPKVLLLDEPTASVDAASAQLIKAAALRARQEWGTTIVVASHDLQWLYDVCDERLHLFRGRVLDTQHATVVFGPWDRTAEGRYAKALDGDARLVVPPPPQADAAAVIHFQSLPGANVLTREGATVQRVRGIIRRLTLERRTGNIIATVMAGDLAINVALSEEQLREQGLVPGQPLEAGYRIEQIEWI